MYFSVRKPFRIANRLYKPCICYDMPERLRLTIEGLVKQELATISEEPIFFQSGAPLPAKAEVQPKRTKEERLAGRRRRQDKVQAAVQEEPKEEAPQEQVDETQGF